MIVDRLKYIGATNVQEISVEEALKKFHITVAKIEHGPEDKESCTSYVIPDGMEKIGKSAFHACVALTSIEIPSSVTKIGDRAFSGCTLKTIKVPQGLDVSNCELNEGVQIIYY